MSSETMVAIVALGVVVFVLIGAMLVLLPKLVFYLMRRPLERRISAVYAMEQILLEDFQANSFGLESAGVVQLRGNGALVLTATHVHFFMFLPARDVRVPIDAITRVTFANTHLGKATIYDLLKVEFTAEDKQDSIAWYVTDPVPWKNRIEELRAERAERAQ